MSGVSKKLMQAAGASVEADEFFNQTTLLLHGDGTNGGQNNTFLDSSTNNFTITRNGNTTQGSFSPYSVSGPYNPATHGGSGYFDGSGDYLTIPASSQLALGAEDFTIEAWVFPQGKSQDFPRVIQGGLAVWNTNDNWSLLDRHNNFSTKWQFAVRAIGGTASTLVSTSDVVDFQWTHVAVTRSGSTFRLFVNGVLEDTATSSTAVTASATVGAYIQHPSANSQSNSYIADARIVKGTALYTASFTPPTAPLTAVTNTELLCNFTNAAIFDSTAKNVLETVGDAQIDTAVVKYGTGSMEFDGTGDILVIPITPDLQFGAGDFTIEGWINVPSIDATYRGIFSIGAPVQVYARSGTVEIFFNNTDNQSGYIVAGTTGPASSIAINTWHHFAVVREGTTFTVYVDGVAGTPATGVTAAIAVSATAPAVGAFTPAGTLPYTGYIDDLRITKGVARYTAAFTPPDRAFPDQ